MPARKKGHISTKEMVDHAQPRLSLSPAEKEEAALRNASEPFPFDAVLMCRKGNQSGWHDANRFA